MIDDGNIRHCMVEISPPNTFWRNSPGMLLSLITVPGSIYAAYELEAPVMKWLALDGHSPAEDVPWYFLTQDLAGGICSLGALVLSLLIAAISWRKWRDYAEMITWMSLVYHGGNILKGLVILYYCPGLLEGQRNTTRYLTFDSYISDWLIRGVTLLTPLVVVIVSIALMRRRKQREIRT